MTCSGLNHGLPARIRQLSGRQKAVGLLERLNWEPVRQRESSAPIDALGGEAAESPAPGAWRASVRPATHTNHYSTGLALAQNVRFL